MIEVLLNNARSLTPAEELAQVIIPNITELSTKSYVDKKEILEIVETIIHYGKKELTTEIMSQWQTLRDNLVGNDFPSLMRRYVGMDLLEDKFDDDTWSQIRSHIWPKSEDEVDLSTEIAALEEKSKAQPEDAEEVPF